MKRFLIGVIFTLLIFGTAYYCSHKKEQEQIEIDSKLIAQQIENVGKLVVSEGHFSEVISYKGDKSYFFDMISLQKNALIVVNAEASVSYDLHQLTYEIDLENKKIIIKNIPKPELKVYPRLKYYDVTQSQFNPFTAHDMNLIQRKVYNDLERKIKQTSLLKNAQNQLLAELSKIWILTRSMEWTLVYHEQPITEDSDWKLTDKIDNIQFKN